MSGNRRALPRAAFQGRMAPCSGCALSSLPIARLARLAPGTLAALTILLAVASPLAIPTVRAEGPAAIDRPGLAAALDRIDAASLSAPVRFLSSDALEGRGPGSAGDRLARLYLAAGLEGLGLQPGVGATGAAPGGSVGEPSWEQPFPMIGIQSQVPPLWAFSGPGGALELKWWDEFIAASGVQQATAGIRDAELVFVGYGIQAPEFGWDDFKGADLRGKVLLMLTTTPTGTPRCSPASAGSTTAAGPTSTRAPRAQGAAGAILIHTTPSAGYPFQVVQSSWTGEQFELPAGGEPRLQVAGWTTEDAARRLVALAGP